MPIISLLEARLISRISLKHYWQEENIVTWLLTDCATIYYIQLTYFYTQLTGTKDNNTTQTWSENRILKRRFLKLMYIHCRKKSPPADQTEPSIRRSTICIYCTGHYTITLDCTFFKGTVQRDFLAIRVFLNHPVVSYYAESISPWYHILRRVNLPAVSYCAEGTPTKCLTT